MLILDTDHMSEFQRGRSRSAKRLRKRLKDAIETEDVATTIVTVEEQTRGWLARIHRQHDPRKQIELYAELQNLFELFAAWEILPWDEDAAEEYERLKKQKIRVSTMDLKIASIAISRSGTLLSRNLRDFERIPDLQVEDWLA